MLFEDELSVGFLDISAGKGQAMTETNWRIEAMRSTVAFFDGIKPDSRGKRWVPSGFEIESTSECDHGKWSRQDGCDCIFDVLPGGYVRLVPIKPEPKYIPFTFEDRRELMGKIVESVASHEELMLTAFGTLSVNGFTYSQLCRNFVFIDTGLPVGKLVKE